MACQKILRYIATKVGWVVGVDRDVQPGLDHRFDGVPSQVRHNLKPQVGKRADREWNAAFDQFLYEIGIGKAGIAMIDAVDVQEFKRLSNIVGRTLLPSVEDRVKATFAGNDLTPVFSSSWS